MVTGTHRFVIVSLKMFLCFCSAVVIGCVGPSELSRDELGSRPEPDDRVWFHLSDGSTIEARPYMHTKIAGPSTRYVGEGTIISTPVRVSRARPSYGGANIRLYGEPPQPDVLSFKTGDRVWAVIPDSSLESTIRVDSSGDSLICRLIGGTVIALSLDGSTRLTRDEGIGYFVHGNRETANETTAFKGFIAVEQVGSIEVAELSAGQTAKSLAIIVGMVALLAGLMGLLGPPPGYGI